MLKCWITFVGKLTGKKPFNFRGISEKLHVLHNLAAQAEHLCLRLKSAVPELIAFTEAFTDLVIMYK